MNALAHCAEGLYSPGRSDETDRAALAGAKLISDWLPAVVKDGSDPEACRRLLEGAMHAGEALTAGMGLGHAMAQALGGRYGLAHGTMNAVCLPPALRYNGDVAAAQITKPGGGNGRRRRGRACERTGSAGGTGPVARLRGAARGSRTLSEAIAARPPAKSNPRPAPDGAIRELLEEIW
jgi:maleylacetate reductase